MEAGGGEDSGSYYYLTDLAMRAVSLLQTRHGLPPPDPHMIHRIPLDRTHRFRQPGRHSRYPADTASSLFLPLPIIALFRIVATSRPGTCSAAPPVGTSPSPAGSFFFFFFFFS